MEGIDDKRIPIKAIKTHKFVGNLNLYLNQNLSYHQNKNKEQLHSLLEKVEDNICIILYIFDNFLILFKH